MADDMERDASGESSWDLDELDNLFDDFFSEEESSEKSVSQLYDEAYELYRQARFEEAAVIFYQAVELAERQGDIEEQCKELYLEGACYKHNTQLYKALNCFLQAQEIQGLSQIYQCHNLMDIFQISIRVPLPLPQLLILLGKLKPYQTRQQIGGSKSMVLFEEYDLL